MTSQQLALSLVLATMVFSVALDLRLHDFRRVAMMLRAVVAGLIPQFLLLPVGTWLATLALDLPPNVEAGMLLVACCPGGSLSNYLTHFGRGNTAWSVTVSCVAAGMTPAHHRPTLAAHWRKPLGRFSMFALFAFIVVGLISQRHLLTLGLLPMMLIVVLHNVSGLACALWWRRSPFIETDMEPRHV